MNKITSMFQDKLFLALCTLVSASLGLGILYGDLSVLTLLFTIFLWMIYAKVQKGENPVSNMRCISGCLCAMKVIAWVGCILAGLVTCLFGWVYSTFGTVLSTSQVQESVREAFQEEGLLRFYGLIAGFSAAMIMTLIMILLVLVTVVTVLAIIASHAMHFFAKSLYRNAEAEEPKLAGVDGAKNWMLVMGIYYGIIALANIPVMPAVASHGCMAAVYIISYILVKKYFADGTL